MNSKNGIGSIKQNALDYAKELKKLIDLMKRDEVGLEFCGESVLISDKEYEVSINL